MNEQDLSGNGDGDSGHYSSVEKQSRYQPQMCQCENLRVKLRENLKIGLRGLEIFIKLVNLIQLHLFNRVAWNVD